MTQPAADHERSVWVELRRLIPALYVPVGLMTLGIGIILPLVPLYLDDAAPGGRMTFGPDDLPEPSGTARYPFRSSTRDECQRPERHL